MVSADFQPKFNDDYNYGNAQPGAQSVRKDGGGGKGLRDRLKKDSQGRGLTNELNGVDSFSEKLWCSTSLWSAEYPEISNFLQANQHATESGNFTTEILQSKKKLS